MILGVITGQTGYNDQQIDALAEADCTFVVILHSGPSLVLHWAEPIEKLHEQGIKVFLRLPVYSSDGAPYLLNEPKYSFKAHDGRTNTKDFIGGDHQSARIAQVSHWNDEAENIIRDDFSKWMPPDLPIDGVLVAVSPCDRMFPTDWYPFGDHAIEGTEMFWSFDHDAQHKWAEFSGNAPMPARPLVDGGPAMEKFYRWYQDGWIQRLTFLSDLVIDRGIKELSTWFLPHTRRTVVNMVGGTADCIEPLQGWREHVAECTGGNYPLMIVACHFPLQEDWMEWFTDGEETIRKVCAPPYDWDLIIGAEAGYENFLIAPNVRHHGKLTAEMGGSGLFMSDFLWLGEEAWEASTVEAINEIRPLFEERSEE